MNSEAMTIVFESLESRRNIGYIVRAAKKSIYRQFINIISILIGTQKETAKYCFIFITNALIIN